MFSPPSCEFQYFYTQPSQKVPNVLKKGRKKKREEMERSFFSMSSSKMIIYTAKLLYIK